MSEDGMGYMTEERRMIRDAARDFTMKEVLPVANALDGPDGEIPMDLRQKLADMGIVLPEDVSLMPAGTAEGDEAATDYFKRKTEAPLTQKFLPIVTKATDKVGLAQTYNRFAGQAAQFGLVKADQASIQQYVTQEALNRLYQAIGEQEKAIRADPVGTGSKLLSKVFGAALGR